MGFCDRCLFKGEYSDMGAHSYTCLLKADLCSAIKMYDDNKNLYSCPYALFYCDLVDALDKVVELPCDCKSTYSYIWSKELRGKSSDSRFELSIIKK